MPRAQQLLASLAISLFLAFAALWNPFLHLFWLNQVNLTLPLGAHLPLLGVLTAIVVGLGLGLQWLPPARLRPAMSTALLVIGVFLWAEGTLLLGDFGFFQGDEPDWSSQRHLLVFEAVLVAGLLVSAWRYHHVLVRNTLWITGLLLLASLANLYPILTASLSRTAPDTRRAFTPDQVFELSADRNVLIFIIDTFQSDVFAEILAEEPRWRDMLQGFTYFPDATCAFPKTYASLPNLLTGESFDNSRPFSRYMEEAYLGQSAPKVLKDHGFDPRYKSFTWQPYYAHPAVANNLVGLDEAGRWLQRREFIQLGNLTLFRLAPFLAKPWAYNDNQFRLPEETLGGPPPETPYVLQDSDRVYSLDNRSWDLEVLDQMLAFLDAGLPQPAFRVFHFEGVHPPLILERDLSFIGPQSITREAFKTQSLAMLRLLELVFERLHELEIYDRSLIYVVGDHGAGEYPEVGVGEGRWVDTGIAVSPGSQGDPVIMKVVRGGTPLVLAKGLDQQGPLEISRAPVELGDLPATIFHALDLTDAGTRPSIFQLDPSQPRTRYHRQYQFAGWGQDYIVPMTEYAVDGFSWDPASWSATGRDLNRAASTALDGTLVILGEGGNLDEFAHSGWGPAQPQGRYLADTTATIKIPVDRESGSMSLKIRAQRQHASGPTSPLLLSLDGRTFASWKVAEDFSNTFRITLPRRLGTEGGQLALGLDLGDHPENPPLIVEIRLTPDQPERYYELGQDIFFTTGGQAPGFMIRGWFIPESWGTWTAAHEAVLQLHLEAAVPEDLELEMDIRPAVFLGSPPLEFSVLANGTQLAEFSLDRATWRNEVITIPAAVLADWEVLQWTFLIRNPRAPRDFSDSSDHRELGLGLSRLVLRRPAPETPPRPDSSGRNVLEDEDFTASSQGFYNREDWSGQVVAWSGDSAGFTWPWPTAGVPRAVVLGVERAAPAGSKIVVMANGSMVGAGTIARGPWRGEASLVGIPEQDVLRLRVYTDTFRPAEVQPGSQDQRNLGLAFSEISLAVGLETAPEGSPAAIELPQPQHVMLAPEPESDVRWSGLYPPESWLCEPISWTTGQTTFTVDWDHQDPPSRLLVDLAGTGPGGTSLSIAVNGRLILDFVDEHPKARSEGVIALQLHAGRPMWAEFRDIRLKRL